MTSTRAPNGRPGSLTCMIIGSLAVWILAGSAQSPVSRGPYSQHPPTAVDLQAVPLRAEDLPFPSQPTDEQLDDYDRQLRPLMEPPLVSMPQPYSPIEGGYPRDEPARVGADPDIASSAVNPTVPHLDTHRFPYSAITKLAHGCSASVVGEFHLLTAAHCFVDHATGNTTTAFPLAIPAQTDITHPRQEAFTTEDSAVRAMSMWVDQPFGDAKIIQFRPFDAARVYPDPADPKSVDSKYDVGLITLDRRIGKRTGIFPMVRESGPYFINTGGYPAETTHEGKPTPIPAMEIRQYRGSGPQSGIDAWYGCEGFWPFRTNCKSANYVAYTYGGHSGGAAWTPDALEGVLSGSNRAGSISVTLLWDQVFDWIWRTIREDESDRPPVARPELIEFHLEAGEATKKRLLTTTTSAGRSVRVQYNVYNVGFASTDVTIEFYLSSDRIIRSTDRSLGLVRLIGSLPEYNYARGVETLTIPVDTEPGEYYVGYILRSGVTEYTPGNNAIVVDTVLRVDRPRAPDLVVEGVRVNEATLTPGEHFVLSATVRNLGSARARGTRMRSYRGSSRRISRRDREVGSEAVGGLAAGMGWLVREDLNAPANPGRYYYGACVDSLSDESDVMNNCSSGVGVTVIDPGSPADRRVLEALYDATGGAGWTDSRYWKTEAALREWHGVELDATGRVAALRLGDNNLNGRIPRELGSLVNLERLWLHENALSGPIPGELGSLVKLESLALHENDLNGPIPGELVSLVNLEELVLHENDLRGPLPRSMTNLNQLRALWIHNNAGLCAPSDGAFQAWLATLENFRGNTCSPDMMDRAVLEMFYDATGGAGWTDSANWNTEAALGDWHGVTLDAATGRVVTLILQYNNLSGPIPGELGSLIGLTRLDLDGNNLSGPIPSELGNLGNLTDLWLDLNNLSGPIPGELGSLGNLEDLSLAGNALSGPIPPELGSLVGLEVLRLFSNNLSGSIPGELGNLGSLATLALSFNRLSGPIPPELGNLTNLTELWLGDNRLSGPIPPELGNLTNLTELWLRHNRLSGPIPPELGNLTNLVNLYLHTNQLSGRVPPELGNLANLDVLALNANLALTGPLPQSLTGLLRLRFLDISDSGLCAPADAAFQAWLATLHDFQGDICTDVANRAPQPVGTIPAQTLREGSGAIAVNVAGYFRDPDGDPLTYTAVSSNGGVATAAVSGSTVSLAPVSAGTATVTVTARDPGALTATQAIAVTVTSASDLTDRAVLEAFYDATDGPNWAISTNWKTEAALDDWYGVTARNGRVTELDLALVFLLGPIPPELGNLGSLAYLDLSFNLFSGPIPPELGNLGSLAYLDLSFNDFSGSIPGEFGNLGSLADLDLSVNRLSGPIPPELGNLTNLTDLWLRENRLSGPIPPELGNLTNLVNLHLHTNQLSGRVPPELGNLANLEVLPLYANPALTGPLPQSLTGLLRLWLLDISDSGLCAPADAAFQAWLATLHDFRGDICTDVANRAPQPVGRIPAQTLREGSGAIAVNVAAYFRDPDGDPLTYTAVTSDGRVVTAVVSGSTVSLTPVLAGTATVTVTARDPGALTATQAIAVTVTSSSDLTDGAVLEAFYDATGGAGWTNSTNWKTAAPLGEWYGVRTGPGGRVTRLDLGDNQLTGQIPPFLGNLSNLTNLSLWVNQLSGPIPPELGNLTNLTDLSLWGNQLSGPIPVELGNLSSLSQLDLSLNQLSGPIPPELWNLRNLGLLWLGHNQLSGPIPSGLGNLSNLWQIHLAANQLSGPIPVELGSLTDMSHLWLGDNRLSGTIPPELANLTYLVELRLDDNQLSGRVPPELGDLANLEGMHLNANTTLTGPLPQSLSRLSRLALLDISDSALCAPADAAFQAWLATLDFRGVTCADDTNRAPQPVGRSPAQTLREGSGAIAVNVVAYFRDPDGDPLAYTAVTSDGRVVTAVVSGSTVSLAPVSAGTATVTVTARDPAGLSATQTIAVTVFPSNRPPEPVGTLAALTTAVDGAAVTVEVSGAFRDPDGDALTYGASSSAPLVALISVSGSRVTIAPVSAGTATVRVTATDVGGSNTTATQTFRVRVTLPFTDDPIVPGVTPVKAAHFTELRTRIDGVRTAVGLGRYPWTDSRLVAGVTPVRGLHMSELRTALAQAYDAAGQTVGFSTEAIQAGWGIRAWHINQLRRAVEIILER